MNDLNRRLILIATTTLALTATLAFVFQTEAYYDLKGKFDGLFKQNEKNKSNLEAQAVLISQLDDEIRIKDDSIAILVMTIDGLTAEIDQLKLKVKSKDQKVQQLSTKVNGLTKQISQLKDGAVADQKLIKDLATERDDLLKKMVALDKERDHDKKVIKKKQQAIADNKNSLKVIKKPKKTTPQKPSSAVSDNEPFPAAPSVSPTINEEMETLIKTRKQARMNDIVANTKVNYTHVALRNQKEGKDLDKFKNDGWRYTIIDFDLKHPNPDAILDEAFILQVFDVDNQKVVPVNESNPGFPDSNIGSTGYRFIYDGQPLSVKYFNSQKKTGKNYEIRLYYAGKGYLIPLPNGVKRIMDDGAVAGR